MAIIIKRNIKTLLTTFLIFLYPSCNTGFAANPNPNLLFRHLTQENGLLHNTVESIVQDDQGFIWIATHAGLSRFDGYEFIHYKSDSSSPLSLAGNDINCMLYDSKGNLWLGIRNSGLNKFVIAREKFSHYFLPYDNSNNPPNHDTGNPSITSLAEDGNGTIWIGTTSHGLYYFHPNIDGIKRWNKTGKAIKKLRHILKLTYDRQRNSLWIITNKHGIFQHDLKSGNTQNYELNSKVLGLTIDNNGALWLSSSQGLIRFVPEQNKQIHYQHSPNNPLSIASNNLSDAIYHDQEGNLWIGSYDAGLIRFNQHTQIFHNFMPDPANSGSISGVSIELIYQDRSGVIWVGAFTKGLNSFHTDSEQFNLLTLGTQQRFGLQKQEVFGLIQDNHHNLWIGTNGYLSVWNRKTNSIRNYSHDHNNPHSISRSIIRSVFRDSLGTIWISAWEAGINRYIPETDDFIRYLPDENNPHSISSANAQTMLEDHAGNFWISTRGGGLNLMDRQTGKFKAFKHDPNNPDSISSNDVYTLYEDDKHNLWVGTFGGGLNQFIFRKNTFIRHNPTNITKNILTIHQDKAGHMWLGTFHRGLEKYNPVSRESTYYSVDNGLIDNSVYGILEDNKGMLWLSTNKGLTRFNPQTEQFYHYDVNDGIQDNEFNGLSYLKTSDNELMFGGINGLTWFNPEKIKPQTNPFTIKLTNFYLFNNRVLLKESYNKNHQNAFSLDRLIYETEAIILKHDENHFGFGFSSFNYRNHKKTQFAYMLDGWDKNWIFGDYKNRKASYSNIPSGTYNFLVKSTTNINDWGNTPLSLHLIILPPPWKTGWAYLSYIIIIISFVYWFTLYQKRRREFAVIESSNKLKDDFLRIISHELRTPINGIEGSLDLSKKEPMGNELTFLINTIQSSTHELLTIIDKILYFIEIQAGQIKIWNEPIHLHALIDEIYNKHSHAAKIKFLDFSVKIDNNVPLTIQFDNEKLLYIIDELVINAIKFTHSGSIHISVKTKNKYIAISVKDSGQGIPKDKLSDIFDVFNQVDASYKREITGLGIGLSICSQLAGILKGEITVESELSTGSLFSLIIPCIPADPRYFKNSTEQHHTDYTNSPLPALTILIVEDNKTNQMIMEKTLKKDRHHIVTADNGKIALEYLAKHKVDFIFMDCQMPVMDGFEAARQIRQLTNHNQSCPIVAVTANIMDSVKEDCLNAGMNDFLKKPVKLEQIRLMLIKYYYP